MVSNNYNKEERIKIFINKLNNLNSNIEYVSGYETTRSRVILRCKRCGYEFTRQATIVRCNSANIHCKNCDKTKKFGNTNNKKYNFNIEKIKQQRESGIKWEDIALEYGCNKEYLRKHMAKYIKPLDTLDLREKDFIETLSKTMPTFTYIGGYDNAKGNVLVKCNKCGYNMYRSVDRLTRKNKNIVCKNCENLKTKEKNNMKYQINKMILEQKRYIQQKRKEKQLQLHKIETMFNKNTLYINNCIKCGKEYIEHSKSKYCAKCRKTLRHKHSGKSLEKLYQRDNGICHICNELCDWNDKKIDKGTIIVGNNYPSIDHIIPLSKGGTDDWNNLGLAHMRCNTIKRDNQGYVSI